MFEAKALISVGESSNKLRQIIYTEILTLKLLHFSTKALHA